MHGNTSEINGQIIHLPDGRRLGYEEYGVASGVPVLFFHGAPGSSYIHAEMAEIAVQCGVRLVAIDRPGYGLSDAQPGRTFLSWADDVVVLIDLLKIDQFSIIGFSGGSPYPLACAYKYPDCIKKVALIGALVPGVVDGMPPIVSGLYTQAQTNPDELRNTFSAIAPSAAALLVAVSGTTADCDKAVLEKCSEEFITDYSRMLLNGIEGIASDYILLSGNYGFPLTEIKTEVHLWSGTLDQNTPPFMTYYLASQLANSQIHSLPSEGHFSLHGHWDEILRCVT